uniref:Uncharacterized protein n=1 Tax=Arundo donax TaxID=35708 RepID=A0A0A8YI17_ARUDO
MYSSHLSLFSYCI